jgi:hypothetical protein
MQKPNKPIDFINDRYNHFNPDEVASIAAEKAALAAVDPEGPFEMVKPRRMKDIDAEVNEVMQHHPTYQRLKAQLAKGLIKYGTPVKSGDYSIYGWFEHLQEESTDRMVYNEMMIIKLDAAIKLMEQALHSSTLEINNLCLEEALKILTGSKEGNL